MGLFSNFSFSSKYKSYLSLCSSSFHQSYYATHQSYYATSFLPRLVFLSLVIQIVFVLVFVNVPILLFFFLCLSSLCSCMSYKMSLICNLSPILTCFPFYSSYLIFPSHTFLVWKQLKNVLLSRQISCGLFINTFRAQALCFLGCFACLCPSFFHLLLSYFFLFSFSLISCCYPFLFPSLFFSLLELALILKTGPLLPPPFLPPPPPSLPTPLGRPSGPHHPPSSSTPSTPSPPPPCPPPTSRPPFCCSPQ